MNPREELRRMIAEKIDEKMHSERMDDHFEGRDYADAVMELFPEVDVEQVVPFRGAVVHAQYVLRTAPEPIEETP